jgi:hypothetical protein
MPAASRDIIQDIIQDIIYIIITCYRTVSALSTGPSLAHEQLTLPFSEALVSD